MCGLTEIERQEFYKNKIKVIQVIHKPKCSICGQYPTHHLLIQTGKVFSKDYLCDVHYIQKYKQ